MAGYSFIDLFCGIGGFRFALEDLGHDCVFTSDNDPHAQQTYELNFGETPFGDITALNALGIPPHDVLCAGFPCQPFSKAGTQSGFSHKIAGDMFFHILRFIKARQPKYLFLERASIISLSILY